MRENITGKIEVTLRSESINKFYRRNKKPNDFIFVICKVEKVIFYFCFNDIGGFLDQIKYQLVLSAEPEYLKEFTEVNLEDIKS